jgi:vacuolar protein sorting-associated protein 35
MLKYQFSLFIYVLYCLQLVRQLQGQGQEEKENPFGDDSSTSPKKIFQLLNQVNMLW